MNALLNKRDHNIWFIFTGNIAPDSLCLMSKSMISEYGSITDVNAIECSSQAKALILRMLFTFTRKKDYPCDPNELENGWGKWHDTITLLSRYTEYCTIKELEGFLIKLFRNHHQVQASSYVQQQQYPSLESFERAMEEIPALDDRSDLRSLTATRNTVEDFKKHENEWMLYTTVSGIKSTPRPPSSPGMMFPPNSAMAILNSNAGVIATPISREEQRETERNRRHQMRVRVETENILQGGFDFPNLILPQPSSSSRHYSASSPSHSVFDSNTSDTNDVTCPQEQEQSTPLCDDEPIASEKEIPSIMASPIEIPIPRSSTAPLPRLPILSKKRPSTPVGKKKSNPAVNSAWKRIRS
jgi:hypothetical protein